MLKIINVFSKKDLNNTKWFFSEKTIQLLTGIYIVPQIFNSLGSADIGKLKLVEAIFAMLSPMFLLGLTAICIREIIYYPKRSNFILATTFYMQLASTVLVLLIMLSYIYFFKVDDTLYIYYLIGFSYLIKTSAVLEYYILAKKWSKIIFISKISSLIVIVSLQYYGVQKGFSVYYFALIIAFDLLIRVSFYIFILLKKNSININQWVFSKVLAKYLFKNSYKLMIANLIIGFYITIDEILLKYYHGDSANGVFSVVQYLVIVLTWNIGFSIINSLYPSLAESYRTNKREYYNKLKSITVIMIVFGVLTAIFYMFSAKYILNTFFSEEYQKAIIPLRIFCWAPLFVFIGMIYEKHLININKLQNNIYRFVIGCVVNVILCVLLIPKWEIVGVAIAVLLSHFITNIVCIFIFKNNLKVLR